MRKHLLVILDGYGIAEDPSVSAIEHARKPFLDKMFAKWPHGRLQASGRAVGLPEGQMGNSEVGHMNLGAGRVVYQDITRIDVAIEDGSFFSNEVLVRVVRDAKANGRRLHLMGLLSDGGVHSHRNHVAALLELCAREGMAAEKVCVHAFTDGRDTDPHSGAAHVAWLQDTMTRTGVGRLATVVGRYFAMDRDHRWERVEKAWRALVEGVGTCVPEQRTAWLDAIQEQYEAGTTDEFLEPLVGTSGPDRGRVSDGDAVIFFNFRSDRARQLTRALTDPDFDAFPVVHLDLDYVTFAKYDNSFPFPVAFPKVNLTHTLGDVVSKAGLKQLRAAETEKYPHVTYFFNGGREDAFPGEDRILVPSPKVATYDLQPEMSAPELGRKVAAAIRSNDYALVVINFANPDMVGHTGDFKAAVKAVEAVDAAAEEVVTAAMERGFSVSIIADHGNCDRMRNPDGSPHTAHTTVPVPHLIALDGFSGPIREGRLGDVAPTILAILGLDQPADMTGESLIN
jgi:2,3-bisphosphoglycerate-independent phosphoglycerate mutase